MVGVSGGGGWNIKYSGQDKSPWKDKTRART